MGRIGLLCHGSNLHRFGIGSNGLESTLKNAKFKGDNILISTQVHSTQFDLSQFDLSYSTKRVDLILFDLFHSIHFMQSVVNQVSQNFLYLRTKLQSMLPLVITMRNIETCNALKCLMPSGLIDWVNCKLFNGWVHIKCANLSKTEARSLAEIKL